jgi:hypothetical protein
MLRPVHWLSLRAPAIYKDTGWDLPKRALHSDPEFTDFRLRAHLPSDNRAMEACARFLRRWSSNHDDRRPHAVVAIVVALATHARSPIG